MIARWKCDAVFGRKNEALALLRDWISQIGSQTDLDMSTSRITTGSVGARESRIEVEFVIAGLAVLDDFFTKIGQIKLHKDWGRSMAEVIVSGSTAWEVFRVVD